MSTAISPTAYNYKVVRQFAIMTVVWGILGMGLGVFIASQLVWPELNLGLEWTTFGRLRPLQPAHVLLVQVDVDEVPQLALIRVEVLLQAVVLLRQVGEQFTR